MNFRKFIAFVACFLPFLLDALPAKSEDKQWWENRFVISQLQPVIDPQMERFELVHMCSEPRVHQVELEPSPKGGVTKTRVGVRPEKEGAVYVLLDDREPGYRMYQIFSRGFIVSALSWVGAEHVFLGSVGFAGYRFESDPAFPLHFKYVDQVGYVHLCGRGTVTTPQGVSHRLNTQDSLDKVLEWLKSTDQLTREAACTTMGYLTIQPQDKDKVVPALAEALKDSAMEVRRNAAEALGRIRDPRALDALKATAADQDDWVREVAADAVRKVGEQ
jgi:hypothetical protein